MKNKIYIINKDSKPELCSDTFFENLTSTLSESAYTRMLHEHNRFVNNRFRQGTVATKTRSQISCTGAKAYKQKGTGNARRGRVSSPLIRGGAVAFGPQPRSYGFSMNKRLVRRLIRDMILSVTSPIVLMPEESLFYKTKEAKVFLSHFDSPKNVLFLVSDFADTASKPFDNISSVTVDHVAYIEPQSFLVSDLVLCSPNAVKVLKEVLEDE